MHIHVWQLVNVSNILYIVKMCLYNWKQLSILVIRLWLITICIITRSRICKHCLILESQNVFLMYTQMFFNVNVWFHFSQQQWALWNFSFVTVISLCLKLNCSELSTGYQNIQTQKGNSDGPFYQQRKGQSHDKHL